jgi:hypothetical protein
MTWNIIKNETGRRSVTEQMPSKLSNNDIAVNLENAADAFNKYFVNTTDKLNIQNPKQNAAISLLRASYPNSVTKMKIIPVTEAEVIGIINSLKSKNSSGYDEISSKILKLCGSLISRPLSHVCNKSICMGIFPDRLKYATVKPLYKKGEKTNMNSYRPVSLLPVISKVFEKTMYNRLNHHSQIHKVLATEQYDFRKGMSTEHATYRLTDILLKAWNNKMHVGGIFCDLARAFDCVNHEILLAKLQHYGIEGSNAEYFRSYLSNRKQRVEIKTNTAQSYLSNWDTVKNGVPQGSVLGPLLFVLYINDLPLQINKISDLILLADDTSVMISQDNYNDFQETSNVVLSHMIKWSEANQLVLNMEKTNTITFKTSNVHINHRL